MNYTKRDFAQSESVALDQIEASPKSSSSWSLPYRMITPLVMACDALIIISLAILCGVTYHLELLGQFGDIQQFSGFGVLVAALFILLAKSRGLYTLPQLLNLKLQVRRIATKWIVVFLFITAVAFAIKSGGSLSRGATISFSILGLAGLIAARVIWRVTLADGLSASKFSGRKVALITEQASTADSSLAETLAQHGLQPIQYFQLPANQSSARRRKETIAQVISSVRGTHVEEIVVSANPEHWSDLNSLLLDLRVLPLPVNFVPVGPLADLFRLSSHTIGDTVTIELQRAPRTLPEQFAKRFFDIIIAGTAVVLFLPLFLMTAAAIKLESPGPIIFQQRRRGFNGRIFKIYKFRTMSVQEDGAKIIPVQPNDTRVTRIGKWLRHTSIDELPQLFNVLQGSMSIVGPRPHAVAHDNEFDNLVSDYAYRQHAKPGLTGWAQVNGYRGQMRTVADVERRIKFDLWYIDNWNLALDFKIMLMTGIELIRSKNAY